MDLSFKTYPFDPHGSDERQYSSQGFRINVASITRDKYYEYEEYHTSLDNLDLVTPGQLMESLDVYRSVISEWDRNITFNNLQPHCEVMLSKHGLYPEVGGASTGEGHAAELDAILWLLFHCDGQTDLSGVATRTGHSVQALFAAARKLEQAGLLEQVWPHAK
jgi:aminopeptidase-like protein